MGSILSISVKISKYPFETHPILHTHARMHNPVEQTKHVLCKLRISLDSPLRSGEKRAEREQEAGGAGNVEIFHSTVHANVSTHTYTHTQ